MRYATPSSNVSRTEQTAIAILYLLYLWTTRYAIRRKVSSVVFARTVSPAIEIFHLGMREIGIRFGIAMPCLPRIVVAWTLASVYAYIRYVFLKLRLKRGRFQVHGCYGEWLRPPLSNVTIQLERGRSRAFKIRPSLDSLRRYAAAAWP